MSVGFYGKLPSHGDFIRRRASDAFVDAFDAWLGGCMAEIRSALGSGWLDLYLTSPAWRFACAAGVCGPEPVLGLLAPSVDSVGRYFPIALVAQLPPHAKLLTTAVRSSRFFAKAEQLIVETLAAERVDFERFDRAVTALANDLPSVLATEVALDVSASPALHEALSAWQLPIAGAREVGEAFAELLSLHLESTYRPLALWWTDGSVEVEPSCLFTKGLPAPERFPAFLDGAWARHQWRVALPREAVPEAGSITAPETDVLSFRSAGATDLGKKRPNNEDGFIERPEVGLWAVADGMGGHRNGEVASRMLCDALADFHPDGSFEEMIAGATRHVQDVNAQLYRTAEEPDSAGGRCGSTVVLMLLRGTQLAVLWAGDSRVYRWRNGHLDQLSRDHSLAELTGMAAAESNIITRAVGIQADLTLDLYRDVVRPDDRFLLCSDGLTRVVPDDTICQLMGGTELRSAVGSLIKAALDAGGPDNITALIAEAAGAANTGS